MIRVYKKFLKCMVSVDIILQAIFYKLEFSNFSPVNFEKSEKN